MIGPLLSAILATQAVDPLVANFISSFSLAATEVELKPDAKGKYHSRADLEKDVLPMRATNPSVIERAFVLLDKNESKQRLVVGDLLLLLIYQVPDKTPPATIGDLRNVLLPSPGVAASGPNWPWTKDASGNQSLGAFTVAGGPANLSLMDRLKAFSGFKRVQQ